MLNKLRLERFKNFKNAELILGPLTVLVGTNASGKSNIRDAFRFLYRQTNDVPRQAETMLEKQNLLPE